MEFDEIILKSIGTDVMFVMGDSDCSITIRDTVDDVYVTDDSIDVMLENGGEVTIDNWRMVEAENKELTHFSLGNQMEIYLF